MRKLTKHAVQETLKVSMGRLAGLRRALMFSGGFDSMLMGVLAKRFGAHVTAVTVQFENFNPITVSESSLLARQIGLEHHIIHVTTKEFLVAFESLAKITKEPVLDLDLAVVHAALRKYDPTIGGRTFISGMGCDQYFGNYALKAEPRNLWVNEHHLVAKTHGCRFIFPFLRKPMLVLAEQIPADLKKDKKLLRSLVEGDLLSHQSPRREIQVPAQIRQLLVKVYGHRAWPKSVQRSQADEAALRQIVLGLWLKKNTDQSFARPKVK